jgi:uncharacterized membrane protein YhaH (DUF805 family)
MTFFEAAAKCYRKYFVFKGRAPRTEFWWFVVLTILVAWPLFLSEIEEGTWFTILSFIYFILTLSAAIPLTAVWTRRMHDVDKSGWTWMFVFIPIVGLILILRWASKEGDMEANKYGEPDNHSFVVTKNQPEE